MPFTKQSNGKYKSPSGRSFSKKQVVAYYASNGFKDKVSSSKKNVTKKKGKK